jgi:hypothetical protein
MQRTIALRCLLTLWSCLAYAQLNRGGLTGTIQDSTGAAIPGVKVTAQNSETSALFETVSGSSGEYAFPNLTSGTYTLSAEAAGFKRSSRSKIPVSVAETQRVDITLEIGSVSDSVDVTAEISKLQTESPEVGTTLDTKALLDLPLTFGNGRLAENFAYKITPGVTGDSWKSNINGSSHFSKETLVDGVTITTHRAGDFGQASISVEALQEFRIQTSGMSAEYGRAQGGVFNYVMKSGTNQVHGSAYFGLRNEKLNANSFGNNARGAERNLDRRLAWAGSFGGPVVIPKIYDGHDKSFFYVTYERFRQRQFGFGSPNVTAPLPEFLDGDFSRLLGPAVAGVTDALGRPVLRGAIYDPATFRQLDNGRWVGEMFPGNRIPVSRFSRVSRNVVDMMRDRYVGTFRQADGTIPLQNNAFRPTSGTPEFDQHQFSVKGDQIISTKHKLSGSISYTTRPRLLLDQVRLWDMNDKYGGPLTSARRQQVRSYLTRVAHDWNITPTTLNTATVYYNLFKNPNISQYADIDGAAQLGISNLSTQGYPNINFGGGPFVSLANIGDPQNSALNTAGYGFFDTVSLVRGRHIMKAGVDLRRNAMNSRTTPGGGFTFNARGTAIPNESFSGSQIGYSFASFLLGVVDSASLSDAAGLGGRRDFAALFFQDDWRVSSRLTLNLGLRWEWNPNIYEAHDRLSSWNPTKIDPASGLPGAYDFAGDCDVCTGERRFGKTSWRDFGPRIGFAYRAANDWVIRGAYGIMYQGESFNGTLLPYGAALSVQAAGTYALNADAVNPWRGIFNWDNGFPTNAYRPAQRDLSWGNRNTPAMFHPDYGATPYIQMWNLNVQRQLPGGVVLEAGYVANKATKLRSDKMEQLNQIRPELIQQFGSRLTNAVTNEAQAAANGIRYPFPGFRGTVASALRDYPQVQGNDKVNVLGAPHGFSTYHGMQLVANKEFSNGLTMYANYTWSKNLTNIQSSQVGDNEDIFDQYNRGLEKQLADDDRTHVVKGFVNYSLPFGRGQRFLGSANPFVNALVGGWSVSAILNYFSGTPLTFTGTNPLPNAWNGGPNRVLINGDMKQGGFSKDNFNLLSPTSAGNLYLNRSAFADPGPLRFGTASKRPGVRGFGIKNEDFGIQKNMRITERVRFQIRGEMLNGFNRALLNDPNINVTAPNFGYVTGTRGPREVQIATRIDF